MGFLHERVGEWIDRLGKCDVMINLPAVALTFSQRDSVALSLELHKNNPVQSRCKVFYTSALNIRTHRNLLFSSTFWSFLTRHQIWWVLSRLTGRQATTRVSVSSGCDDCCIILVICDIMSVTCARQCFDVMLRAILATSCDAPSRMVILVASCWTVTHAVSTSKLYTSVQWCIPDVDIVVLNIGRMVIVKWTVVPI